SYSSKIYRTPFKVELREFIGEKFPGTETAYKSFQSDVTVHDDRRDAPFDFEIYMNHILNYDGYRLFQASFFPDEKGTVLSVNHDFWGTNITYFGYYLLYLGLMLIMFIKGSRFKQLEKKLSTIKEFKKDQRAKAIGILAILFLVSGFAGYSQSRKEDIP